MEPNRPQRIFITRPLRPGHPYFPLSRLSSPDPVRSGSAARIAFRGRTGRPPPKGRGTEYGGPDRTHETFTDIQKAINYSKTSYYTTGENRDGKKKMDKFNTSSNN